MDGLWKEVGVLHPIARDRLATLRPLEALAANRAWDREHGPADLQWYRKNILPKLAGIPLRQLVVATGLSNTVCGLKIPHPRHWEALQQVARAADEA